MPTTKEGRGSSTHSCSQAEIDIIFCLKTLPLRNVAALVGTYLTPRFLLCEKIMKVSVSRVTVRHSGTSYLASGGKGYTKVRNMGQWYFTGGCNTCFDNAGGWNTCCQNVRDWLRPSMINLAGICNNKRQVDGTLQLRNSTISPFLIPQVITYSNFPCPALRSRGSPVMLDDTD